MRTRALGSQCLVPLGKGLGQLLVPKGKVLWQPLVPKGKGSLGWTLVRILKVFPRQGKVINLERPPGRARERTALGSQCLVPKGKGLGQRLVPVGKELWQRLVPLGKGLFGWT